MIKKQLEANEDKKPNSREMEILKKEFPSYFDKDGQFMIDKFKQLLEDDEVEMTKEGYELNFLGKSYARLLSSRDTETVIVPDVEHNEKEENKNSENVYIVGDNLDALQHLRNAYSEKIKCIYIDPPYNTGSDGFVYPDNFNFSLDELIKILNIEEDEAERILDLEGKSTHSAWLTFMYPRLLLSRSLLSDDGVIFISIDENEQVNLKMLCDDVFGEENFAGEIIWKNSSKNDENYISMQHEYIIFYTKNKNINSGMWSEEKEGLDEIFSAFKKFENKHSDNWESIHQDALKWYKQYPESNPIYDSKHYSWMDKRGVYFPSDLSGPSYDQYRYDIIHPITGRVCKAPTSGWRFPKKTMKERIKNNLIHFPVDETTIPCNKTYLIDTSFQSMTSVKYKDGRVASNNLKKLLGGNFFTNPKDVNLIGNIVKSINFNNDKTSFTVLDFFSGSATTAHAVMALNAEDGGNRKHIMVQLEEKIDEKEEAFKAGYHSIDEIGRERIERAAKKIKEETKADIDYGYKAYYLQTPTEKTIDDLISFKAEITLDNFTDDIMINNFSFKNKTDQTAVGGKTTILCTWMTADGCLLTQEPKQRKLFEYQIDIVEKTAYIIETGLQRKDIQELIRLIEDNELDINKIVVYPYSLSFTMSEELKKNINVLKNDKQVSLIERF